MVLPVLSATTLVTPEEVINQALFLPSAPMRKNSPTATSAPAQILRFGVSAFSCLPQRSCVALVGLLCSQPIFAQVFDLEFGTPVEGTNSNAPAGLGASSTLTTLTFLDVAPTSGTDIDMRVSVINETNPAYYYSESIPNYSTASTDEPNNDLGYLYFWDSATASTEPGGITYKLEFFDGGGTFTTPFVVPEARFLIFDVDGEPVQTESVRTFTNQGFVGYQIPNTDTVTLTEENGGESFLFTGPGTNVPESDNSGAFILYFENTNTVTFQMESITTSGTADNGVFSAIDGDLSFLAGDFSNFFDIVTVAAKIEGSVLEDTNNDGIGELPIAGVELTLKDSAGNDVDGDPDTAGVQPTTTVTDSNGNYTFQRAPGDYQVVQTQPAGFLSVSDTDGANNDVIGDENLITVAAGETNSGNDFVEERPGVISGTVSADTDNDDVGETGLLGVEVQLFTDPNGDGDASDGALVVAATTGTDGSYSFENLAPGDYVVVETQPAGFNTVSDGDSTVPGDDASNISLLDNAIPVSIAGGETDDGNDFLEEAPGSLSGQVLADNNNDGGGDDALANVVLTLKDENGADIDSDPNTAGVQPTTTSTDSEGNYSFAGLPPGNYQVVETDIAGFQSVSDVDGANNNIIGDETPIAVTAGQDTAGNDFVDEQLGSLSGQVLQDTDNNNVGDAALADVVLTLKDENGNDIDSDPIQTGVQATTTSTDSEGNYSFPGLPPGNYQVVELDRSGFISVSDVDGANNNTVGDETPIAVTAGADSSGNDFVDERTGGLRGTVLADTNNDDVGDAPLANVVLTLKDENGNDVDSDPNTPGVQPTTTITGSSGFYLFSNLPPGNYQIVEQDLAGYGSVKDSDGANNNIVGDETPVTVVGGFSSGGNNFVDEQFGSLSGQVLEDTDNDDNGDAPLANVVLTLKDENGDDIDSDPNTAGVQPTTTSTDDEGIYSFAGLPPGNYQVVEADQAGFASVSDVDGANNNTVGDETPIAVTAGADTSGNDFVDERTGDLRGSVLADTDNDDVGDAPLANVVLTLKDENGDDIDSDPNTPGVQPTTAITDSNGFYIFSNLSPGDYQIVEQDLLDTPL